MKKNVGGFGLTYVGFLDAGEHEVTESDVDHVETAADGDGPTQDVLAELGLQLGAEGTILKRRKVG